jgi:hypothetical protein
MLANLSAGKSDLTTGEIQVTGAEPPTITSSSSYETCGAPRYAGEHRASSSSA